MYERFSFFNSRSKVANLSLLYDSIVKFWMQLNSMYFFRSNDVLQIDFRYGAFAH